MSLYSDVYRRAPDLTKKREHVRYFLNFFFNIAMEFLEAINCGIGKRSLVYELENTKDDDPSRTSRSSLFLVVDVLLFAAWVSNSLHENAIRFLGTWPRSLWWVKATSIRRRRRWRRGGGGNSSCLSNQRQFVQRVWESEDDLNRHS